MPSDTYTHGHHASVLRSHTWRTAENSAAYLLDRLAAGQDVLDVGCGPGTITVGIGSLVAPGRVVGIDAAEEIVDRARQDEHPVNVSYEVADVYSLPFDDGSFDVVHAHQVLQHLSEPVAALGEMRRVLRPGGIVAVRDGDFGGFVWAPRDPVLDQWMDLYHRVTRRNGAEADGGRFLPGWVRSAGFDAPVVSSSTWTFADAETCAWWGGLWADRVRSSSFADQAVAYGLAEIADLERIAGAFLRWSRHPDAVFVLPHIEVIATKGA
jgi:SAM-dependent methyltransferase